MQHLAPPCVLFSMQARLIGGGILIALVVFVAYFICCTNIVRRIYFEQLSDEVVRIREGQAEYKKRFGRYGTLQELAGERLASGSVADGYAWGFSFTMAADRSGYQLRIQEIVEAGDEPEKYVHSSFVDESGVIRESNDPAKPADATSYETF